MPTGPIRTRAYHFRPAHLPTPGRAPGDSRINMANVPQYAPASPAGRSLPPWERCGDCGALVLPAGHSDGLWAPHDTDCLGVPRRGGVNAKPSAGDGGRTANSRR